MDVIVTGGSGFIGVPLMRRLRDRGFYVRSLDLRMAADPDVETIGADITSFEQMEKVASAVKSADAVVHLAAMAAPRVAAKDPDATFRVNVQGTHNVLQLAKKVGASRFIFASSAHVYGISPLYMPTDESHPTRLHDNYTTTKIIGEQLCDLFYRNEGISYCALRQFNGYGPGQSLDYFIPAMIEQAKHGTVRLKGKGVTKDFVYVEDMAEAISLALMSDYVGPLNVGTGIQTTLEEVAQTIARSYGVPLEVEESDDKGPTHMQADIKRIRRTLGWEPKWSLLDGLGQTMGVVRLDLMD